MVVTAEGPHHVARLHQGGKEAAVERGPADSLVLLAPTDPGAPDLVPLREGNVEEREGGQLLLRLSELPPQEGGSSPVPGDLVVGDPVVVSDPQVVVAPRVQEVERGRQPSRSRRAHAQHVVADSGEPPRSPLAQAQRMSPLRPEHLRARGDAFVVVVPEDGRPGRLVGFDDPGDLVPRPAGVARGGPAHDVSGQGHEVRPLRLQHLVDQRACPLVRALAVRPMDVGELDDRERAVPAEAEVVAHVTGLEGTAAA